ncbi:hypothetical protein KAT63_05375 [Candidatus Parcubacteria bacterium]|nr:hypothetical protein [Candidatus Parcubacteria bacterium]
MEKIKEIKKNFDDYVKAIDQLVNIGSDVGKITLDILKDLKKQNKELKGFIPYKQKIDNTIRQIDDIKNHPLLQEKYKIIHKHSLVLVVSNFESFMNSLFRVLIDYYPDKLKWPEKKNVKIDLSLLKYSSPSAGDLIVKALKGEINFQDLQSTKRFLEEYLGINIVLKKDQEEKIIFYQALRHIIIHNSGVVDPEFLKQVKSTDFADKYKDEEEANIDDEVYNDVRNVFFDFVEKITNEIIKS